ncbi:hypothetical protein WME91_22710 [Sorangium sp. So ce269]
MPKDRLRRFDEKIHFGAVMLEKLERDGFELTHARPVAPRSSLLRAKPPQQSRRGSAWLPSCCS